MQSDEDGNSDVQYYANGGRLGDPPGTQSAKVLAKKGIGVRYGFNGEAQYHKNGKMLSGEEHGRTLMYHNKLDREQQKKNTRAFLENPVIQALDPSGVSNYPAVGDTAEKLFKKGAGYLDYQDVLNVAGAIPVVKGINTTKKVLSTAYDVSKGLMRKGKVNGALMSLMGGAGTAAVTASPVIEKAQDYKELVNPAKKALGGEIDSFAPQTLGGDLVPIGDGVEEVVGNKHNQTTIDGVSGVQLLENGQPTAEVENGEVIVDGDRVLSNRLMFDANNSYADKMKQLTKKRNKLEAMQEKAKGYRAKNTIERKLASLNAAESTLFQHQEETKYAEGMNELQNVEGTPSFRWGGKTPIPTPFKNNAKDLIFPKTDYGAILNRRLPQLATTELTDPVVSPNAEVKEKSMDEVVLTKKKPAAPPVNATNPLGYAMNPVTADFKVPDTNVHYTPPPSKLDSFLASDAGQFVSTVAPMLIDNVGNAIASKNTPKLPTPLLQYARPLETRVNINPQLAEVRRSNKSIKDTILSNTSNSNTARNAVVSANLSADKQVMDLYGGKENQELQLRNANVQQQQMVDNQNAVTLNQHSMNVYQRANDIASKSSANLANLAGDITNASQMVKTDKNFKAYTNANLLDDAEGSKLATYLNNDEYLKDPRNRAFVKSLLSNPYTANKYKHLMPRAQQLGLVN